MLVLRSHLRLESPLEKVLRVIHGQNLESCVGTPLSLRKFYACVGSAVNIRSK